MVTAVTESLSQPRTCLHGQNDASFFERSDYSVGVARALWEYEKRPACVCMHVFVFEYMRVLLHERLNERVPLDMWCGTSVIASTPHFHGMTACCHDEYRPIAIVLTWQRKKMRS